MPNLKKPTALKKLEGNPGKRPFSEDEAEVTLENEVRPPPEKLTGYAREYWLKTAPMLFAVGLLTPLDYTRLEGCATRYAEWQEAEDMIKKTSRVIKSPSGYPVQSPFVSIGRKALNELMAYESTFGMSPTARAGAKAIKDRKKSKFGQYSLVKGGGK